MKAQHEIQARKQQVLLLLLTGILALAAGSFTSQAAAANTHAALLVTANRAVPPVEPTGTYRRAHPTRKVVRDATALPALTRCNTAGIASPNGVLARVDATGHVVNAKGARVGAA